MDTRRKLERLESFGGCVAAFKTDVRGCVGVLFMFAADVEVNLLCGASPAPETSSTACATVSVPFHETKLWPGLSDRGRGSCFVLFCVGLFVRPLASPIAHRPWRIGDAIPSATASHRDLPIALAQANTLFGQRRWSNLSVESWKPQI